MKLIIKYIIDILNVISLCFLVYALTMVSGAPSFSETERVFVNIAIVNLSVNFLWMFFSLLFSARSTKKYIWLLLFIFTTCLASLVYYYVVYRRRFWVSLNLADSNIEVLEDSTPKRTTK